jgi:hypothetical protein
MRSLFLRVLGPVLRFVGKAIVDALQAEAQKRVAGDK